MVAKRRSKRSANASGPAVAKSPNVIDRVEGWLRRWGRYPSTIALLLAFVSGAGWVIDKTLFRVPGERSLPAISIYNTPAEKLDTSLRSYFQLPAYKELNLNYGGSLEFPGSHTISAVKIGTDSFLMLHLAGEQESRAFDLSKMPVIPFSIQIEHHGIKSLLTVEQIKDTGIQIRTFRAIK
jgi:hypothetical protein